MTSSRQVQTVELCEVKKINQDTVTMVSWQPTIIRPAMTAYVVLVNVRVSQKDISNNVNFEFWNNRTHRMTHKNNQ